MKPKILIMSGYGLNCEEETKYAFEMAGGKAQIVHINDLIAGEKNITDFQAVAYPGGFSYGDDTGSGNAFANKVRNHLWDEMKGFIRKDRLVIGICNGFQILVNLGLLPAFDKKYGNRDVALIHNDSARYTVRWVDLIIENDTPWLKNMKTLSLPIAHGEGKFYASNAKIDQLKRNKQIALRYIKGDICDFQNLAANPNGSLENIAGITDESGKILGLMPHPERAIFFTQLPDWTNRREIYSRTGKTLPQNGPGLEIFRNAVRYFS